MQAKKAAISLLRSQSQSIVYNMLLADVLLASQEVDAARKQYELVGRMLDRSKNLAGENKRYLQAYKNYRLVEISFYLADQDFNKGKEIAGLIHEIDADRQYKRLFSLPG
ncbi:hypothetical protein EU803_10835 [Loktanella sp. IMCC34160]|uniref:hypothetical protein n=1 Tax=Loktanella sp. IMCC34160 TaxID=2510646 RepID=UPI00101B75CE|nr:hypothetical protein [Loktanella sp. IMCC34160]RYG91573.1 hypothetical protein EU803_10835 [Loktanella sp. IMCC34160]